ncbi:MAG: protein-disulfide reductase DsbD family protein [Bacteroidetes bacterium]|nr:protein-disulfide reductase DsbD family protein [Bacteroidota bacterium]
MKKILIALVALIFTVGAFAQPKDPVVWKYEAVKKSGNNYELIITATVPKPWHIYSQNTPKGGPIPTKININTNPLITIAAGKAKEIGKQEKVLDKNFSPKGVQVLFYSDQVQFVQSITLKGAVKTNVTGTVEYMVCDDSQCLPPTKKSFDIKLQ